MYNIFMYKIILILCTKEKNSTFLVFHNKQFLFQQRFHIFESKSIWSIRDTTHANLYLYKDQTKYFKFQQISEFTHFTNFSAIPCELSQFITVNEPFKCNNAASAAVLSQALCAFAGNPKHSLGESLSGTVSKVLATSSNEPSTTFKTPANFLRPRNTSELQTSRTIEHSALIS